MALKTIKAYVWFVRRYGLRTVIAYEIERRHRERTLGRSFDPKIDGEPLLRRAGATEQEIARARAKGLA